MNASGHCCPEVRRMCFKSLASRMGLAGGSALILAEKGLVVNADDFGFATHWRSGHFCPKQHDSTVYLYAVLVLLGLPREVQG